MLLRDKVCLITGGGRGIGRCIALEFARNGADLVLASRSLRGARAIAADIMALGRNALVVQADVSQGEQVERMVASAIGEYGRIDVLVNSAAVQGPLGPLWEADTDSWLRNIATNLGGVFLCCRSVIPSMMRQGGGKIINLSGGGAASPRPFFSAYSASKAAVARLTETLASEVRNWNIQVNAISPGAVYSEMTEEVLAAGTVAGEEEVRLARLTKEKKDSGRAAADLAVFLASAQSDGLTGRLLSAVWDDWRSIPDRLAEILRSEAYTLRRITE